jgi:NAD(P)-dependent dehydrogenase (short-subunit alcohol dehydrogenase family)
MQRSPDANNSPDDKFRQLEGRAAIVTGAGRGIGAGIARVLASRGARVAVADIDESLADGVAAEIRAAGGEAIAVGCDVTDRASMDAAVSLAIGAHGPMDICVPNAGVVGASGWAEREDFTDADWDATLGVNVRGLVNTTEAAAPGMKERQAGKIVIVASQGGRQPRGAGILLGRPIVPYLVSKAAAIQFTHLLAQDLGKYNINVNCVCPGTVWTDIWEQIGERAAAFDSSAGTAKTVFDSAVETRHPLAIEQTPEDIGFSVAFLASDQASEITGQALNVNAGSVLS